MSVPMNHLTVSIKRHIKLSNVCGILCVIGSIGSITNLMQAPSITEFPAIAFKC